MDASSQPAAAVSTTLADWFATPLGHYLLTRELAWFDRTVADIFGYHAIQIGLPEYAFLAQSRIATRWTVDYDAPAQLRADPHWLPFAENALDLIVLPHALEFTPSRTSCCARSIARCGPRGRCVIAGFNPFSLFGAKRYFGREQVPAVERQLHRALPAQGLAGAAGLRGHRRRPRLLRAAIRNPAWRARCAFFESAGDRWWPIAGGVYYLRATKRVTGMRVITPAWQRPKRRLAPAPRQARECIERNARRALDGDTCHHPHRRRVQGQPRPRRLGRAAPMGRASSASSSAASRRRPTTGWSSPRSSVRSRASSATATSWSTPTRST